MLEITNYIGGELVAPASGDYLDNFDPSTGEVYSLIPDSDDRDVASGGRGRDSSRSRLGRKLRLKDDSRS